MKFGKRMIGVLAAGLMTVMSIIPVVPELLAEEIVVSAASETYPVQQFRLGIGDTDRVVSSTEEAALHSQQMDGTVQEKWSLHYVSEGVYEIVSSATGEVVTYQNGTCVLAPDTDQPSQCWQITAVEQDFEGYDLYYKITSVEDNSLSMTFQPAGNLLSVEAYTGSIYQKFKLQLDGLEGYAANAMIDGQEKAGTIGGLLGDTVFVNTTEELVAAMKETVPLTIVITGDCDFANWSKEDQKIEDDKTILGAYDNATVYDSQWRNDDFWGDMSKLPSNNIVIQNVNFVARTLNSSGSGVILLYIYCGRNVWIDHCSFSATFAQNKDQEVGKFIWVNTPVENWSDGCYNGINPDYLTISYNHFYNRYWTVAFGSQNSDTSRIRTTLMYNYWEQCARRTPQIGNGTGHIYNNFYAFSGEGSSNQIIGGDGSNIRSENCRFEGLTGLEITGGGSSNSPYIDVGSYTATDSSATPVPLQYTATYESSLAPWDSYGYSLLAAYDANGQDAKVFCQTYAGRAEGVGQMQFVTDSALSDWVVTRYKAPFLRSVEVTDLVPGAVLRTDVTYVFENANSGWYLEVADSLAQSGANVQQGNAGARGWRLADAGDGYYYIYTTLGDGATYCLDLSYGSVENGTNIGIWGNDGSDAKQFKFLDNGDGTYTIATKCTQDSSAIGVVSASTEVGANVVQWVRNDSPDQKWVAHVQMQGNLMEEVLTDSRMYDDSWQIDSSIAIGDSVGNDDSVVYTQLPEVLTEAEALQMGRTGCKVTITAAADITLYAGMIESTELTGWTKTEQTVQYSDGTSMMLYQRDVSAGEMVTLDSVDAVFAVAQPVIGDVNADGICNVADAVALQKWLLGVGTIAEGQAGDLLGDGRLNVMDLAMLRAQLLNA